MFKTGEYFLYTTQGICQVDNICDHEINGANRRCYVFHPINNIKAKITTPVDNQKVLMRALIPQNEANDIMQSFGHDDSSDLVWDINKKTRHKAFSECNSSCDAELSARTLKLLLSKKAETLHTGKKLPAEDERFLGSFRRDLSDELAIVLGCKPTSILDYIDHNIKQLSGSPS